MTVRKRARYFMFVMVIWLVAVSCIGQSVEVEACSPDDGRDYVNSIDEHVTEIGLSNWAVLATPGGTEVLDFWTGTFQIECVREIEGQRPWVRLIAPNGDAGWTAP